MPIHLHECGGSVPGTAVPCPLPPDKRLTALEVRLVVGDDRDFLGEPALALLQHLPDRFRHLPKVAGSDDAVKNHYYSHSQSYLSLILVLVHIRDFLTSSLFLLFLF